MMTRWQIKKMLKKINKVYNSGTYCFWTGKEGEYIKEMIDRGYLRPEAFILIKD